MGTTSCCWSQRATAHPCGVARSSRVALGWLRDGSGMAQGWLKDGSRMALVHPQLGSQCAAGILAKSPLSMQKGRVGAAFFIHF